MNIVQQKIYDVIIIGAGFSGCMTAKYLDTKLSVLLIDANNLILKKFLMTGTGYSNITNTLPINEFMENIIDNNKFMYSALTKYNSSHILAMCDDMQIKYFEKTPYRIHFKDSNEKFKETLHNELKAKSNLDLIMNCKINSVSYQNGVFCVSKKNEQVFYAKQVVVATGGMSYGKFTNSDGYGYVFAKEFKHTIKTIYPIGVGINVNDQALHDIQGSSATNVTVYVYNQNNKIICQETSDLMVTHFGLGGPVIRRVSGYISQQLLKFPTVHIKICFIPSSAVQNELHKFRYVGQCFRLANQRLIDYLFNKTKINNNWETANLTKAQTQLIVDTLSEFHLDIQSTCSISEAINTGGGINLKELNPSTYMSKLQDKLYFIGEVIDVNPRTNGFNLTICYASARTVADTINQTLE